MASSHKNTLNIQDFIKFCLQYVYVSVLVAVILFIYTYWGIIKLRYFSDFFASGEVSAQYHELFIVGFGNNLSRSLAEFTPYVAIAFLASGVAYTLYNAYKNTFHDMHVSSNYINAVKQNPAYIALHYTVLYSAAFVIPLLFWCYYLINWFPALAKFPLSYILNTNILVFVAIVLLVLIAMIILTHIGLVVTRLSIRLFKVN